MSMTLDRMVEKDLGVFSSLTDDELFALEGNLALIDLQSGCPHQCLGCGADAKPAKYSMPWEKLLAISDGIKKLRKNEGIDVLPLQIKSQPLHRKFRFFDASDPAHYRSFDSEGNEKTIFDAGLLFFAKHGIKSVITTAGWKPGDTYMERAMKQLVGKSTDPFDYSFCPHVVYSLKPFTNLIVREFDEYFKGSFDFDNFFDGTIDKFFEQSRYVSQAISNLKLLGKDKCNLWIQYLDDIDNLPDNHKQHRHLFSVDFTNALKDYCFRNVSESFLTKNDDFVGIGRASRDFGLPDQRASEALLSKVGLEPRNAVVLVDYEGTMHAVHQLPNGVETLKLSNEFLLSKASEYDKHSDYRNLLSGMAGLNGKNLFDGGK